MTRSSRFSFLIAAFTLGIAALACNIGSAPVVTPTLAPAAAATDTGGLPAAPTPTTEAAATTAPANPTLGAAGGWLTSPTLDISTLPDLAFPAVGMGPSFCSETLAEPTIILQEYSAVSHTLCIYNWPLETERTVQIDMTDPNGVLTSATYFLGAIDTGWMLADTAGGYVGTVQADPAMGLPLAIALPLQFAANTPTGTWQATVLNPDTGFQIGPTPVIVEHFGPLVSVLNDIQHPIFAGLTSEFTTNDVVYIFGSGYSPNTQLTIALYSIDEDQPDVSGAPALHPQYATTVTTDASGAWSAQFQIGAETLRENYSVVVAPQITPEVVPNPFMGGFNVY